MTQPFATHLHFWKVLGGSALVGALTALAALIFLGSEDLLTGLLWGEEGAPLGYFSGSWTTVAILMAAALVVGLVRKLTDLGGVEPNFIQEMVEGRVPLKRGLAFSLLGLVSLVGGASVGPEAPLGTIGGTIGTAVGRRYEHTKEATEDLTFAGIAGVFGSLATFPFAGVIMALETYQERWQGGLTRMLPGVVSSTTALAILYPVIGTPFIALYDLGEPDLKVEWIGWAILLGVLGAVMGLLIHAVNSASGRLSRMVTDPLVRALIGGAAVAAIGFVLPITLFSGRDQLHQVIEGSGALTLGLLGAIFLGKLATFALSMRWGFFGGPIFPLMFLGAIAGAGLHLLVPAVPVVVAVPALAAAVAVAIMPLPMMIMILATMMFGLRLELGILPAVAVVASYIVVHGTGAADWVTRRFG